MSIGDLSIWHWVVIVFPLLVAAVLLAHGNSRKQRKAIVSGSAQSARGKVRLPRTHCHTNFGSLFDADAELSF